MGGLWSIVARPARKFNIESRVQKVLSKEKPIPSPLYPQEQKQLDAAKERDPEFTVKESIKDTSLDERLKQVYVKSDLEQERSSEDSRPLPSSRVSHPKPITGYMVPEVIPPGKCTLETILNILDQHHTDPQNNNFTVLALKYKLSEKTVASIIEYHCLFVLGMTKQVEAKLKKLGKNRKFIA